MPYDLLSAGRSGSFDRCTLGLPAASEVASDVVDEEGEAVPDHAA